MKEIIRNKKSACLVMAAAALLSVVLMFFPGFAKGRETSGRTLAYASVKYGNDTSGLDMKALAADVSAVLGVKADVGITGNLATGYTNVLIQAEPAVDVASADLKAMFDEKYAGLEVDAVHVYQLGAERTGSSVCLEMLIVFAAFAAVVALYELLNGKGWKHLLTVLSVSLVSALCSSALLALARVPFGKRIVIAEAVALLSSALLANWQLNNYELLARGRKKKQSADSASSASALGWGISFEAALLAVVILVGMIAGALIAGTFHEFGLALCLSVPVAVSAFASQLFGIRLFAD